MFFLYLFFWIFLFPVEAFFHFVEKAKKRYFLKEQLEKAITYEEWKTVLKALNETKPNNDYKYIYFKHVSRLFLKRNLTYEEKIKNIEKYSERNFLNGYIEEGKFVSKEIKKFLEAFSSLVDSVIKDVPEKKISTVLKRFKKIQELHGKTALSMSGGGILGKIHIGVLKSLYERGLFPEIISGTSVGSIIAAMTCINKKEELGSILCSDYDLDILEKNNSETTFFTRVKRKVERLFSRGTLLDERNLSDKMKELFGEITFKEAFIISSNVLNVVVSFTDSVGKSFVLNHITAPDVYIWSAVVASCSVPGLFRSHTIIEKIDGRKSLWKGGKYYFADGSISMDIPLKFLKENFNVQHGIVCQLNPHVYPFVKNESKLKKAFLFIKNLIPFKDKLEKVHCFLKKKFKIFQVVDSLVTQDYTGDTTIVPEMPLNYILQPLSSIKQNRMTDYLIRGEKATWKHVESIEARMFIEKKITKAVSELTKREDLFKKKMTYRFTLDQKTIEEWVQELKDKK